MTLTPRQQHFAETYALHGNATRAALDAGYKENSAAQQGHALLRNPKVRLEVEGLLKASAPIITRDVIVRELWKNHLACQPERVTVPRFDKQGEYVGDVIEIAGEPQASNRALELLAKMGGMMIERSEVQVTVTRDLVEAEIARLEKELAVNDPSHA